MEGQMCLYVCVCVHMCVCIFVFVMEKEQERQIPECIMNILSVSQ